MTPNIKEMPVVALRGLVVFPSMALHFDIGRDKSIAAIEAAMDADGEVFLVAQRNDEDEDPGIEDLYPVGAVAKIKQILRVSGNAIRVLVEGEERAHLAALQSTSPYLKGDVQILPQEEAVKPSDQLMIEVLMRRIPALFETFSLMGGRMPQETMEAMAETDDPSDFADLVAARILTKSEDKQRVLETTNVLERLKILVSILEREMELLELDHTIASNVRQQVDKNQKEYFLREQIKAIQRELGEPESDLDEVDELREKIDSTPLSEEAKEVATRELGRMAKLSSSSPEWSVVRTYLETILGLPWGQVTEDNLDLTHARQVLNEDHYGLEKVKDRIVEFLAVRTLKNDTKGPILCLAGPPGVGKTSIAKSIARALDKKYVRMSLGGVRDEAEIRGHRRTYVGAIPGRVLTSLQQAKSMNPVFLLDEIDKMNHDFRGDPASAMLEVLDPEINATFRDHYLDIDFDLSQVLFITTANDVSEIPGPLYDRMEVIEIDSYTDIEKVNIAKRHLVAKQEKEHGLAPGTVKLSDAVLMDIVHQYTAESGVRELERRIAAIMRKAAASIVEHGTKKIQVTKKNLKDYLGLPKRSEKNVMRKDMVGVVNGLAWTAVGGTTLCVEVSVIPGSGKLELTGQLGDVMKESAKTAISVVRGMSEKLRFGTDVHERTDLHIHVPEGAVPKDGPSAGVTMVTAIASALTRRPVRHDIAMTGEITLTGRVLRIGGVKEKVLAALRAGIHHILLPKDNANDLEELPESVRKQMDFTYVSSADEVLRHALTQKAVPV